jgi:hypothetical protein
MLVRNRANLVQQRTRYRLQLTAIEDVVFPELKEFFKTSITGTAARMLLKAFPTPSDLAEASAEALREVLVVRGRVRNLSSRLLEFQEVGRRECRPDPRHPAHPQRPGLVALPAGPYRRAGRRRGGGDRDRA